VYEKDDAAVLLPLPDGVFLSRPITQWNDISVYDEHFKAMRA